MLRSHTTPQGENTVEIKLCILCVPAGVVDSWAGGQRATCELVLCSPTWDPGIKPGSSGSVARTFTL